MLAAATRLLAMTQMSVFSPPRGHRLRSITRSCSVQPTLLHRAFVRDQLALGQRSMSGALASLILKQYHTCDVSCHTRKRQFRVFSIWGNHHRNNSQAHSWPASCHPCRSIFSSSKQKEEEEDRWSWLCNSSAILLFIHSTSINASMQESPGVYSKSWWQCNGTTASSVRKGDKGFCKRTAYSECW